MTEYDLNSNGKIDPDERELMLEDRRLRMEDADHKRDAQLTYFIAISGLVAAFFGFSALGSKR